MTRPYTTRSGATQYKPSLALLHELNDQQEGFCLACGTDGQMAEPDMRAGHCENCGARKVYGAEELILMGLYYDEEPALRAPGLDDGESPFHPIPGVSSAGEY